MWVFVSTHAFSWNDATTWGSNCFCPILIMPFLCCLEHWSFED
jgi:hypothetical protein